MIPLFYLIFITNPPPPSPWELLWTFREPQFCPRGLWIPPCVFLIRFNQGGNECFQPRLKWHRHKKTNYFPINSPMMAFEGSSEFFFQLQCHAWFELRETLWIRHKLQVIAPVFPDFLTNEAIPNASKGSTSCPMAFLTPTGIILPLKTVQLTLIEAMSSEIWFYKNYKDFLKLNLIYFHIGYAVSIHNKSCAPALRSFVCYTREQNFTHSISKVQRWLPW